MISPDPNRSATLFCRVSSSRQSQGYSPEAQQRLGEEYAKRQGLTITRVFQVVETASKQERRKKWLEYLAYVRRGPEKHALVASVDRALRNYADLPEVQDLQVRHGKTVHFFLENLVLDGTARSVTDLRLGISAAVAVWYSGELAEKVRRGIEQKARKGEWPNRSSFGYKSEKGKLVLDPKTAPWVKRIKELSAEARYSIDQIREITWKEGGALYGKKFTRNLIERTIRNPLYAGRYEWPKGSGEWYEGIHEPIVSWTLHEAAVAGLERKSRPRYRKHEFAFAGMIRCGCCPEERAVVFEIKKGRHVYAHCTGTRYVSGPGGRARACSKAEFVPLADLEAQVEAALKRVQISEEMAAWLVDQLAKDAKGTQAAIETRVALLKGQLSRLKARIDQAYADKLDGKIDEEFWSEQQRKMGAERVRLEESIKAAESAAPGDRARKVQDMLELSKNIVPLYKIGTIEEKRRILNFVCSNFLLTGKKLDFKMKKPFAELAEGLVSGKWWGVQDAIRTWAASQPIVST